MKFMRHFLIMAVLVSHTVMLGMDEQEISDRQRDFILYQFLPALVTKHGKDSVADRAWEEHFLDCRSHEERFQLAKKINTDYQLGLDDTIKDIEKLPRAAVAQPSVATSQSMSEQQKQDAIDRLSIAMRQRCEVSIRNQWPRLVPFEAGNKRIIYLKRLNGIYKLGFDTVIKNIEEGAANPFGDATASPAQPAPNHQFSDVPLPTNEDKKNAIAEEPKIDVDDPDDDSDSDNGQYVSLENINGIDVLCMPDGTPIGPIFNNQGTPALKTVTYTEEQKRNAQMPYKSTQYNDEDDETVTHPSFTASPVSVTQEDKRNLLGHNPPSGPLGGGVFKHGNSKSDAKHKKSHTPLYTTTTFLRSPLFVGFVVMCGAIVTYIYWQDQKTKKAEEADNESESNGEENIYSLGEN